MNGENYIPNPKTPQDHWNNVQFQFGNVRGYMATGLHMQAAIKARVLADAANDLAAALADVTSEEINADHFGTGIKKV